MNSVTVVLLTLALASGFGLWRRFTDGRARAAADDTPRFTTADLGGRALGERVTILQFSSSFCAPCRATKLIAEQLVGTAPDVAHIEINAEEHLDLVNAWDIRRTPTVLLLDATGAVRARVVGQPRKADLAEAVAAIRG